MKVTNSNIASTKEAKTRKTYSEEEYVNFYLSQNLVGGWDAEEFLCRSEKLVQNP